MRRSVTFSLAWVCAAGAATFAAGQGVALVTHAVTSDRPAALTAADVDDRVAGLDPDATTTVPSTATTAPSSSTTTAPSAQAVTRTYNLTGGTATFRFSPDGVTVVSAVPNSGFTTETEAESDNGTDGIRVQFESGSHRSRITAWWDGGPRVDPREQPR
jgi:hypothetical protein